MKKAFLLACVLVAGCTSPAETQSSEPPVENTPQSDYYFGADLQGDVTMYLQFDSAGATCDVVTAVEGSDGQTGTNYFRVTKENGNYGLGTGGGGSIVNAQVGPVDTDGRGGGYSSASFGEYQGNVTMLISAYGLAANDFGFLTNGSIGVSIECTEPIATPTIGFGTFIAADPDRADAAVGVDALYAGTKSGAGMFGGNLAYDEAVFFLGHAGTGMAGRLQVQGEGFTGEYTIPLSDNIWNDVSPGDYTLTLAYEFAGTFDIFIAAVFGYDLVDANEYSVDASPIDLDF